MFDKRKRKVIEETGCSHSDINVVKKNPLKPKLSDFSFKHNGVFSPARALVIIGSILVIALIIGSTCYLVYRSLTVA